MRESPATVLQAPEKAMKAVSASASRYAMIHQVLRDAIVNGTARHGLVLLEAPLLIIAMWFAARAADQWARVEGGWMSYLFVGLIALALQQLADLAVGFKGSSKTET